VRPIVLLLLAAVAFAGCGAAERDSAKEFKGAEAAIAKVVEDLETAARANEPNKVCAALLDDRLLAALKEQGTNCRTGTKDAFEDADSFDLTVKDVTISGATATAKLSAGTGSGEKDYTLEFARDGSAWKIASLR
jgi:hypothetical protein